MRIFFWIFSQKVRWRCEISKRNRLFYISHRPNKNLHQQYQIQILLGTTMYFWILQPWNCKSVNPFFTTLVWRKEKGVCINFTKIASNEVVTQKFDCHQQLSSTKVCLWKKWTMFFTFVLLSCWWRSNFRVTISFDVIFMNFFLFRLSASSAISIWFSRGEPQQVTCQNVVL